MSGEGNSSELPNGWKCTVCGKQNHEKGKIQRLCITCGREKGYSGSKKTQELNRHRMDITPFTTAAKKDDIFQAKRLKKKKIIYGDGSYGKQPFLFNKSDYEMIAREHIKNDAISILASLSTMKQNL